MASRRLFDGATIEIGQLPIVGPAPPAPAMTKIWLNVAGVWKETTVYIRVGGVWKTASPAINITGTWKT